MKIYISGKITGEPNHREIFRKAWVALWELNFTAIDPCDFPDSHHDKSWKSYMKEDLRILKKCDAIFMLNNWQDSRGAKIEHWFAKRYNKTIIYQP